MSRQPRHVELPDDLDPAERELLDALSAIPPVGSTAGRPRDEAVASGSTLGWRRLDSLFDVQLASRLLDHAARWLRGQGRGFYTIGSAGHESNALVAAALRPTDPALLHYRSGAFYLARAQQVVDEHGASHDGIGDVLRSLVASRLEPIAGGRHKVFGNYDLAVIPQTSTIASHLPRAVGVAAAISKAAALGREDEWLADSVVVCSFGDGSLNHSTAQGALNAAGWFGHQERPLPLLFVCEDNGLAISVPSAPGWVERSLRGRAGLRYEYADGTDPLAVYEATEELVAEIREFQRPAVLHLRTVRYGGHAGTDVEAAYRSPEALRADRLRDPLVATARVLVGAGVATPDGLAQRMLAARQLIRWRAGELAAERHLASAAEVIAPLAPRRPAAVAAMVASTAGRAAVAGVPGGAERLTLAEGINRGLAELLVGDERTLLFGEDVGHKGGVYGVTRGLHRLVGPERVFDTVLDEQTILGHALGAAVSGFVPIPEIQYLAYVHNAIDQLRGEAATLSFFSQAQYTNGMVVRIAGLGYQKGFGGHFHNDNSLGGLRDIPGVVVAVPSNGADALAMLRTCYAAAAADGTVSVFVEPIALYHTRDLHDPGDDGWLGGYVAGTDPAAHVPIGSARLARDGDDVLVVTFGNGVYLSQRVAERLAGEGIGCRVLDLRWLVPLPIDELLAHAAEVGRVVVVDETRHLGGAGEAIVAALVEHGYAGSLRRVAAKDCFIPLGDAANLVLLSEHDIADAIRATVRGT